jgi:hypothetical protein
MALVRIEVAGFEARIYSPFSAERVELIKTIPYRTWDKEGKCWRIPVAQVPSLTIALQGIGDRVQINQAPPESGPPPAGGGGGPGDQARLRRLEKANTELKRENQRLNQELIRRRNEQSAQRSSWAEHLLIKLSPDQAEKAYKKLALVLHPDVGGDNGLMRDLNVAFDLLGRRSRA